MSFNNFAIVPVERNDYKVRFWRMTKCETMNRMKNVDQSEKSGQL